MIRRKTVLKRIDAVLDPALRRSPVSPVLGLSLLGGVTLLTIAVALFAPKIPLAIYSNEKQTNEQPPINEPRTLESEPFKYTYTGIVVDENGDPVENATVELSRNKTTTDSQGRFSLEYESDFVGAPRGFRLRLRAVSDDGKKHGFGSVLFSRELENTPAEELQIVLLPELTMTGMVVDAEGLPVADAVVQLRGNEFPNRTVSETKTSPDGKFAMNYPDGFSMEEVFAFKPGQGFDYFNLPRYEPSRTDRPKPDYQGPYRFKLEGAKPISVKAVGPAGEPLDGVKFLMHSLKNPDKESDTILQSITPDLPTITDETGTATFDWFPVWQGKAILWVMNSHVKDDVRLVAENPTVLFDSDIQTSLTIPFVRTVSYRGTIRDQAGNLVSPIRLRSDYEDKSDFFSSTTIRDGQFEFRVPEGKTFDITVVDDHWDAPPLHGLKAVWGEDRDDLEIVVHPTTQITVAMTSGPNKKPTDTIVMSLVNEHGNSRSVCLGRLEKYTFFSGPGTYSIFSGPNESDMIYLYSFTVPENTKEVEVNLHLERDKGNGDHERLRNREEMKGKWLGYSSIGAPLYLRLDSGISVTGTVKVAPQTQSEPRTE